MKRFHILILVYLVVLALESCDGSPAPIIPSTPTPVSSPALQEPWDKIVEAAKKEGTVVIYALWRSETRELLTQSFKKQYGINLEFLPFGRGAEMLARVQAERRAGLNVADLLGAGAGTLLSFKKQGLLGPSLESSLMLPEVKNPSAWRGGQLPYLDSERRYIGMVATPQRRILYNTDLVKENEITGYKDLLKSQYKGKIILNDPTVTGAGVGWFADLARNLWNVEEASEFLSQLIKQQGVTIIRDNRFHVESVAKGKYSIAIAPLSDIVAEFIKIGAPIKFVRLKEGVLVAPGAGAVGTAIETPHPNAARVFLNWLLTREGQTLLAVKGFGSPSFRLDTSPEGVPPVLLLGTDEKYWLDTEDLNEFRAEMLEVSKKVIEKAAR